MKDTIATCTHCNKEVAPEHTGPCPHCGKVGKNITIFPPVATIEVKAYAPNIVTSRFIRRQLDNDEKSLWDKLIIFLRDNIIVDGFEVGFPSGIKIKFKRKRAQEQNK